MVLVVVRNREVMIKGYGETAPGSGRTPDASSFIRLCSVSKVLTADVLLKLVADGHASLNDPLQRYAPHGKLVPTGDDGTQITLLDLATHTAGLTREVSSYPRKTPHFTFPGYAFRWSWLPTQKLISNPGTVAIYSNIGFDLLGDALATATGEPFAQLLHDRLLHPLNMWDTTLFPSVDQCARLLQPIKEEGLCTATEASGASGGLYSTGADMAKLLQYLLQTPGVPAQPAAALAVQLDPQKLKSFEVSVTPETPPASALHGFKSAIPTTLPQSSKKPEAALVSPPTSPSIAAVRPAFLLRLRGAKTTRRSISSRSPTTCWPH